MSSSYAGDWYSYGEATNFNSSDYLHSSASIFADSNVISSQLHCSQYDIPEIDIETAKRGESKLGLKLTKTPSLLNLFSKSGSSASKASDQEGFGSPDKLKASNFPALSLRIGSWTRESRHEGDLIAKCYFKKRQLVWEVLNGNLKNKIEFQWSNISAIQATFNANGLGVLDIMLEKPPLFYHEVNPQPRKHTNWEQSGDFTNQQASLIRKHRMIFGPGVLEKHYNKIIQADSKLHNLSQKPFPVQASMYFPEIHFSNEFSYVNFSDNLQAQLPLTYPSGYEVNYSPNQITTGGNYQVHQDNSPTSDDQHYYVNSQPQIANSSPSNEETMYTNQQGGYEYPSVIDPMITSVGLQTLGYDLPHDDYTQQSSGFGADFSYTGESHQSSYEYDEGMGGYYHSSYGYQSYNDGGNQWI